MVEPSSGDRNTTSQPPTAENIKSDARDLKETAVRQGEAKAGQEKQRVGKMATSASSAMQTAAEELRNDGDAPDWLASAFTNVAEEVGDLADRLQGKSPRELAGETRRFARDNPTAFLAASAAAGFAGQGSCERVRSMTIPTTSVSTATRFSHRRSTDRTQRTSAGAWGTFPNLAGLAISDREECDDHIWQLTGDADRYREE